MNTALHFVLLASLTGAAWFLASRPRLTFALAMLLFTATGCLEAELGAPISAAMSFGYGVALGLVPLTLSFRRRKRCAEAQPHGQHP